MGPSPVLLTRTVAVFRPTLAMMASLAKKYSPGFMLAPIPGGWSSNWIVYGDQLSSVRKGSFHLHFVQHLRDSVHQVIAPENLGALDHDLSHALAVARRFQNFRRDDRDCLRIV